MLQKLDLDVFYLDYITFYPKVFYCNTMHLRISHAHFVGKIMKLQNFNAHHNKNIL